jgi:hypothetical protein
MPQKKVTKAGPNFSLIKSQDNIIQATFHTVLKEVHLFICYGNNAKEKPVALFLHAALWQSKLVSLWCPQIH